MFVMLLGSFTYAQITDGDYTFDFTCPASPVSNGTRAERLAYIQSLTTTNTTIIRVNETAYNGAEGDKFEVYYGETLYSTYRFSGHGSTYLAYGYIETVQEAFLTPGYNNLVNYYITPAQDAYDAAALIAKRADFESQLEAAFDQYRSEVIFISLTKDINNDDVISISSIHEDAYQNVYFGKLIEEGDQDNITYYINGLSSFVDIVNTLLTEALEEDANAVSSFTGYSNDDLDIKISEVIGNGANVKGFFYDLVGSTTSSNKTIGTVTASFGDGHILLQAYINASDLNRAIVIGPIAYYSDLTAQQLKGLYLDLAAQANSL